MKHFTLLFCFCFYLIPAFSFAGNIENNASHENDYLNLPAARMMLACSTMTITPGSTNVTCFGGTDGTAFVTVVGGVEPITFLWNDPGAQTTSTANGLAAGSYNVIVTDSTGCADTLTIAVSQPTALSLSTIVTNEICNGGGDGAIDLTVSGGTPGYNYSWSNTASTEDINSLTAGNYTVTVTDNNGCIDSITSTVTEPAIITVNATITNISCVGGSNGAIDITVSGGTAGYSYSWSNGPTTEDISGLASGSYTVTVTDANACVETETYILSDPAAISLSTVITNVSCPGGSNGTIDLTVTGGNTPYTYLWNNSATTEDLSNLTAGTYTVTVTDSTGCTASASVTITEPAPMILSTTVVNVSCNGGNNGFIDLTVSGGVGPFTYNWNNGATSQDIVNLIANTYIVTVVDNNGCIANFSTTITQPAPIVLSTVVSSTSCNGGNDGSIDLTVTGGTPNYTFNWGTGATTEDVSGLAAGSYSVTVTDDNSCSALITVSVTQPSSISFSSMITNVSCNGSNDGSIDLTVSGGTGSYSYSWSNGPTTEDISGLAPGSYTVTVTDANGCTGNTTVAVSQPSALTLSTSVINASCFGVSDGSINLVLSGGTGPFSFNWSNGASTEDLNGIGTGSYSVTVTDNNGCTASTSATITSPTQITLTTASTSASCGVADGSASVSTSGGSPGYTYLWNDPSSQTNDTAFNVGAGTYSVIVTDAIGCVVSTSVTVSSTTGLTVSAMLTNASCYGGNNGAIDLTVSGGSPSYSFVWSNSATTEDISGLTAGVYAVTVTDNNGCSFFTSFSVLQPNALLLSTVSTNPSCNGANDGSVDLTVSGGSVPYQYSWSNSATTEDISGLTAGVYSVTVTDNNGCTLGASVNLSQPAILSLSSFAVAASCNGSNDGSIDITVAGGTAPFTFNWSNTATTEDISGLTAGTYTVTVTDTNGCSVSVSDVITEPSLLSLSINSSGLICNGAANGWIDLTVTGGVLPYTYLWSNNATTQDLGGLSGGSYTVVVTDNNNCTATVTVAISEPPPFVITVTSTDATCGQNNGSAIVVATGGTPGYTYQWNDPASQITDTATNLSAGGYGVTVTDGNGCLASGSAFIIDIDAPELSLAVTHVTCNGLLNGAIDLSLTGGTPPFTFNWNNAATTEDISSLTTGSYSVTVTDSNNCAATISAFIAQPNALILSATSTNNTCFGDTTGSVNLTVTGGTTPYNILWNNSANTEDIAGLPEGTYVVSVSDSNNCYNSTSVDILTLSTEIIAVPLAKNETCEGKKDGSISVTVSGGSSPYTFEWSNTAVTKDISNLRKGTYTLLITDNAGCTALTSVNINVQSACESLNIPNSFTPNGDSNNDTWILRHIEKFPGNTVEIFNRWGSLIFRSEGYSTPWDGSYNGEQVASAAYYYIINLGNGDEPLTGTVTIVR